MHCTGIISHIIWPHIVSKYVHFVSIKLKYTQYLPFRLGIPCIQPHILCLHFTDKILCVTWQQLLYSSARVVKTTTNQTFMKSADTGLLLLNLSHDRMTHIISIITSPWDPMHGEMHCWTEVIHCNSKFENSIWIIISQWIGRSTMAINQPRKHQSTTKSM